MTQEFDIERFLSENLPSEADNPVPVVMSSGHAMSLAIFLQVQVSLREKRFRAGEVTPSERIMDLEDSIAILAARVDQAIGEQIEPKIYFDITRREIDDLGTELLTNTNSRGSKKFTRAFRKPVYESYLVLEEEFTAGGGKKNNELRRELLGMLKTIK